MGITIQLSPRVRLVIDGGDDALSSHHDGYTPAQLGLALHGAGHVAHWHRELQRRALERVRGGETIPGWRLLRTLGPLQWRDDAAAAAALEALGVEPRRVMTPAEVTAAHGEKAREVVAAFAVHREIEPTLVPDRIKAGVLLADGRGPDAPVVCRD